VGSDERAVEGTTILHAVYQVQLGDLIYFARGERVRRRSGDPAHGLVAGDPVQFANEGDDPIAAAAPGQPSPLRRSDGAATSQGVRT